MIAASPPAPVALAPGLIHHPGYLGAASRARLAEELAAALEAAPPYTPAMPGSGRPFSVRMSNCGPLGWVSSRSGYRYQPTHPETDAPWPPIPPTAQAAWDVLGGYAAPPEACLVNLYPPASRMGLHQDRDEADMDAPVVSLSLGATAVFRYGGLARGDPTRSIRLVSGDALVIGGASRLIHHGVDRLLAPAPGLFAGGDAADDAGVLPEPLARFLPAGGRCNLTLRRVTPPDAR